MIVGIDASRANHEQKTGVEWYAFHVIEEMKKITIENKIEFVLYSDVPLKGELAKLPPGWTSKVLRWPPRLRSATSFGGQAWRFWTQVRMSWEMLWHTPDVLFIPAHVFPIIHPKKTVMTVHDVAAMRFPESYNWFERWYSLWSARAALKSLWKVITPSQFTKDELMNLESGILNMESKVVPVAHGYDKRYKKIENEIEMDSVLKKYSIQTPFIMSVGRLEEKKNTVRIIEAFNLLRSQIPNSKFQILLIGQPGFGYEKVKVAIEQSHYKQDIITPGWVSPDDVPYLMNAASVFVFPSLYEGFGIPVLEAMACGTPVVASTGSCLEEVGGTAAVYVDPQKPQDIAAGVKKYMEDATLRTEKIRLGLERVNGFGWEKCAKQTFKVLLGD